jgi:hypothetical protein
MLLGQRVLEVYVQLHGILSESGGGKQEDKRKSGS